MEVLSHEACMTKHYLVSRLLSRSATTLTVALQSVITLLLLLSFQEELQNFARRQEELFLSTSFRACNLQGALDLLQEVEPMTAPPPAPRAAAATSRRWLPRMTPTTNSEDLSL